MATYNPKYKVAIIDKNSIQYDVTEALLGIDLQESDGEIAQRVTISLANAETNGQYLSGLFDVRNRVFVYANDGEKEEEVFRGFIWARKYTEKKNKELSLTCYDNLIFFQESEEYQYFSAGYSTQSICDQICSKWGVKLSYNYRSITHPKLPLRGTLSDIFLTDILGEVKKKTGAKFVMRSKQDVVHIDGVGSNALVYKLHDGTDGNAIEASSSITMQGMVTKVVILGKEDKNDRAYVADIVNGNTSTYGTLQKVINVSSGTTLADAKAEASATIAEKGAPKKAFSVQAVDIPWIRKGDRIQVNAGDMSGDFIVTSITHYGGDKTMSLEAERV